MKRAFTFLLLTISFCAFTQDFHFIPAKRFSTSSSIIIDDMQDYIYLIKNSHIENVFYNSQYFIAPSSSMVYLIESHGYKSFADLSEGQNNGFRDGESFYLAKSNELRNQDEVDYFRTEYFQNAVDYHSALNGGFIGSAADKKTRRYIKGIITRDNLSKRIRYANYLMYYILLCSNNHKVDENGIINNKDVENITKQSNSNYSVRFLVDDKYSIFIRIEDRMNPGNQQANSNTNKKDLAKSDAMVFYLAMLSGYDSYKEYSEQESRDYTIKEDKELLENYRFVSISDMEAAGFYGFGNGKDYYLAKSYSITDPRTYKNCINEIEKNESIIHEYNIKNKEYGIVIKKMLEMPKGQPISIERFVEKCNAERNREQTQLKIYSYNVDTGLVDYLLCNTPKLSDLFVYARNEHSFYRK